MAGLEKLSEQKYVSPIDLALAHLGLGQNTEAVDLLEQAVEEGYLRLAFLGLEPRFDPLRSDARFQAHVQDWPPRQRAIA